MIHVFVIFYYLLIFLNSNLASDTYDDPKNFSIYLPIFSSNRLDISDLQLTEIGAFGLTRKARPNVPEHYHTGIDIRRPNSSRKVEPVFPIAKGVVLSKRTDGPFAHVIIEHEVKNLKFWTLTEHISGISVEVGEMVDPFTPIARFMNSQEIMSYGKQFDHIHFEVLKKKPIRLKDHPQFPDRKYQATTLSCYTPFELSTNYFDPIKFFGQQLNK